MNEHEITAMGKLRELVHCRAMIAELITMDNTYLETWNRLSKERPANNIKLHTKWANEVAAVADTRVGIKSLMLRLHEREQHLESSLFAELEDIGYTHRRKDSI
jgi:hypothetical protein